MALVVQPKCIRIRFFKGYWIVAQFRYWKPLDLVALLATKVSQYQHGKWFLKGQCSLPTLLVQKLIIELGPRRASSTRCWDDTNIDQFWKLCNVHVRVLLVKTTTESLSMTVHNAPPRYPPKSSFIILLTIFSFTTKALNMFIEHLPYLYDTSEMAKAVLTNKSPLHEQFQDWVALWEFQQAEAAEKSRVLFTFGQRVFLPLIYFIRRWHWNNSMKGMKRFIILLSSRMEGPD